MAVTIVNSTTTSCAPREEARGSGVGGVRRTRARAAFARHTPRLSPQRTPPHAHHAPRLTPVALTQVVNFPYDGQNCVNIGGFRKGHGDGFFNNTCLVGIGGKRKPSGCGEPSCMVAAASNLDNVGGVSQCDPNFVKIGFNKYVDCHMSISVPGSPHVIIDRQVEAP